MGRPRQFNESTVVSAATEVFWQKGYRATNLTDLCSATKMNRPSLYGAFGDKEDLFIRCLEDYQERFGKQLAEAQEEEDSALGKMVALLGRTAEFFDSEGSPGGCLVVLSMGESRGLSPRLRSVMENIHRENLRNFSSLLEEAIEAGELPATIDVESVAEFLVTQIYGAAIQASVNPGHASQSISVAVDFLKSL
ncbi:MAG: TetR/AcrR family transcriptional regulator [Verrucomicrobiota bacterium]